MFRLSQRLGNVQEVAVWRLCQGCGACADICPEQRVQLVDFPREGLRPVITEPEKCEGCDLCLKTCPACELNYSALWSRPGIIAEVADLCGPVLEIWEGHAADPELRFKGASGGLLTALALFGLEKRGFHGVLHIGPDPSNPLRNQSHLSRTRADLLARCGSRYLPASACDSLKLIEQSPAPCVFIGRPDEVSALRKAQSLRPELNRKVGLALSFFCAGVPATQGTLDLLAAQGIRPEMVGELRYRGHGWPGHFTVLAPHETKPACQMPYAESWSFLQKFRPLSVHLWPDGTGEEADISCGDPWHVEITPEMPGSSLAVVRTEYGRAFLQAAAQAGFVEVAPSSPRNLLASQKSLLDKRRALWGRRLMFQLCGLPTTRLVGFPLRRLWRGLPWREKMRSTLGTLWRILRRGYYRPLQLKRQ